MISISTPTYDINGTLRLNARFADAWQGERRASVTATLDGSSSVYDTGFSYSDQTLSASLRDPTRAQLVSLRYLTAVYGQVVISCDAGVFLALLSFSLSKNACAITARTLERLDG